MIKKTYKMHIISVDVRDNSLTRDRDKVVTKLFRELGFDIDDTIADGVGFFVPQLNKHFNRDVKLEDVDGRFCDVYGIEQPLIDKFFKSFGNDIFKNLEAFPKVVECINKWYDEGYKITIITARPLEAKETTITWLAEKGVKYHELLFDEEKSQLAKERGIEIFVDDHPKVVEAMHNVGVTTLFMDIPKNRKNFTSEGIYRVKNWDEVYLTIEGLLKKGGK